MATVAEPPRPTLLPWSEVKSDPRYEFAAPEQRKRLLDTWYSKQATQALQDPSLDPQSVLSLQFQRKFAEAELEDPTFAVDTSDSKRQELVQSYLQAQNRRVKQTTADTDFLVRKREGLVDKAAELSPRQSEALAWYEQSGLANTPDFQWATRRIGGELQVNPVLAAQGVEQYKEAILQSDASDTEKLDALASYNFLRQEAQADLAQTLRSREGVDRLFGSDLIEDDERELVSRNLFAAFITDEEVADYPKKGASAIRGLNPENREQVIDNVINEWLVDKGGHELAKRARKGDETARAQIYNLYRDAVISMPELWVDAEDVKDDFERVRQLSTGEFIMNPSWVAATPPDKLREELTRMKVPEDRVEGLVEQGDAIREVNASRTVAALLGAWYRDGDELKPYGNKFLQAVGQAGGQAGGFLGEALGVGAANFRAWFRRNGDQYDNDYDMLAAYKAQNKGVFATINNTIAKIERGIAAVPAQAAQIGGAIGTSIAGSGADFMETATGAMRDLKEASAAQGGVPFVDDIATELTWMAATAGAGGLLARGGARVGGTQAANQMLRNRAHRQLSQLAAQGNYGKGAEIALRMLATSPEATGAALGRRFAGVGYFGIAGARSAGNVYSEGFSAHKERALAMGASEEVATEVARTNALIPALGAGVATMFLMKAVPGGLESFFKGSLDDVTFKALRERLGDDVVRQGFKNPEFKKAFVTVLGGGALREGGKEALEEGLDEGIQSLIAATTFDPDMTLGEAFENIIHGAILGGLLGSAVPLADSASRATGELRQTQAELLANAAANGAPETAAAVAEAVDSAAPAAVGSPATPPAASGAATPSTPPPTTPPTPTVAPTTLKEEPLPDTEEALNQQLVSVDAEIQTVRSQLEEVEESDPVSEAARRGRNELAKLEATKSEIESKLGNLVAAATPDTAPPPGTTPAEDTIPGVAEGAAAPPAAAPPATAPPAATAPEPVSGPTATAPEPVSESSTPAPQPEPTPPPAAAPTTNEDPTQIAPPSAPATGSPATRPETPRTEVQAPAAGGRGARQPGPAAGGTGQPERGMTRKRALEISNAPLRETYTRQEAEELLESVNQAGRFFEGDALAGDSDARSKLDELGELRDTLTGLLAGTLTTEDTGVTITELQTTATNEQQPTPQPAGAEQPPAPAPTTPAPAEAAPGQPAATGDRDVAAGPGQADAGATGELRREVPSGRPQPIVVGGGNIPAPRSNVPFDEYSAVSGFNLSPEQQLGVQLMVDKFEAGGPGFLLGDGTGFGKTAQIVVAAHELVKRTGQPILVVTMSAEIIRTRFIPEMEALGIPTDGLIELTTYSQVRAGNLKQGKYAAAFFDEAHSLKNSSSKQAQAVALINRDYSVYATATPMDKREAATYFISDILGMAEEDVAQELGLKPTTVVDPKTKEETRVWEFDSQRGVTHAEFLDRLKAFRDEAILQGAYLRRDFPFWGTVTINAEHTLSEAQKEEQLVIRDAWDSLIEEQPKKRFNLSGQKTQELKKWAELEKVKLIAARVQQQLAAGNKVVVFAERDANANFSDNSLGGPSLAQQEFNMPGAGLGALLRKAFDDAGIAHASYSGQGNTKKKRDALKAFQVDGTADVLITTPASGGTGIDLDDQVGDSPRHIIMATPNFSGDVFDQIVGRVSRRNTKSPASLEVVAYADALGDVNSLRTMRKKVETLKAIQGGDQDKLDFGKLEETTRSEAEKSGGRKKKPSKPRLPSTFPTSGLNWVTEGDKSRVILSVADNPELDENARRQFWNYWEKHKDEARSRGVKPFKEVDPVTGEEGPWQLVVPTAFLEQLPGGPVARTPAPPAEPITEAEATASVSDEQRRTEAAQSQEGTPAAETPEVKTAPPGTGKGFFDELRERLFPESAAPKKDPKAEAKTRELKPSDVVRLINAGVSINGQQLRQLYRLSPAEAKAQAETINAGIARKYPSAPRPDNVVLITKKDGGPKHSNDYKVYRDKTTGEETPVFTNNSTETAKALSNGERMVVPEGVAVNPAILTQDGVVVGVKVPFNAEGEVRSPRPDPETTGEPDPADEAVVVGAPGSGRPTYADVFAKFTGSMSAAQRARGARAEATGENLGKNLHLDSLAAPYPPELAAQFGILPDANGRTADPEAVAMQVMNEMFPKAASKAVYKNIPPSERDRAQVTATMELFDWMRNANTHRRFAEFRATVSQDNTLSKEEQDERFVELVKGNFPPGLKDYLIPLKRGDLPKAKTFKGKILAFEAYLNDKVLANFFEHSITNRAAFLAGQQLNNKLKGGTQQKGLSVVAQGFAAEEDVQRQVVEDAPAGDQNVRVVEQATPEQERREQAAFTLRRHNYKGKGNLADPASLTEEELGLAEVYRAFQAFAEAHAAEIGRMAPGPIDAEQIERILTSPSETAQLFWDRFEAPETLPLYEEFLEKLDASYAKNIDALNVPDAVTQQIEQDNFFEANRLGLRSNDPESVRRALTVIATGRGFSPELRTAARLLLTADVDLDNVEFRFFSNPSEDYAGRFSPPGAATAGPNGRAAIDINFSKRGGRGVADTLVHEMVHFTLDALIADPQTDVQRQLVHELERIRIRAGAAFETANANFDGFLELWHGIILDEVGSKTDGQVLYEIARSKSPLAKAYKPGMSQDEQRALLFDIKREEYGATEAFNRHEDLRYALLDDEGRSHGYAAKEFVAHLMTDPKLGSFLRRIGETYTKKGGRKYQIFKGPAWQLTMRNFAGMLLGQRGSVGQDYSTALSAVLNLAGTVNAYPNVSEKKALSERFFLIAEGLGRSEAPLQIPRLTPGAKRMQAAQAFFGTAERLGRSDTTEQPSNVQNSRAYDNTFLPKDFRTGKFTTVPGSREADPDRLEEIYQSLARKRIAEAKGYSQLAQGGGDVRPALPVFDMTQFGPHPSSEFDSFEEFIWGPKGLIRENSPLKFIGEGAESTVVKDLENPGVVWKFLPKEKEGDWWGLDLPMGVDIVHGATGADTQSAMFDKSVVLNHMGTPTEIVGVMAGIEGLILKQPELDTYLKVDAMEPFTNLGVDTNGVELVEAPEGMVFSALTHYVAYIENDYYILGDLRGANVGIDSRHNVRILDAVVSKITPNILALPEFQDFFKFVKDNQEVADLVRQEFSSPDAQLSRAANGSIGAYHEARSQQALQEARKLVGLGMSLVSPQRIAEGVAAVESERFGEYDAELGLTHFATKVAFDILKNPSTATSISEAVPTTLRQVVGDILLAAANVSGPAPTTGDGLSVARMRSRFREFRDGVDPDVAGAQNARASALRWKFADNPQMSFLGENPVDPALYGGLGGTFGKDFRRWLTKEGKWGKEFFPIYIERQSAWKRTSLAAELREKELRGAIQRAAKAGKPVDITVLNKALGATANPLHPDVQKAAKKSFRDAHGALWSTYMQRLQRAKALERRGSVTAGKRLRRRAQDVYQGRAERARVVYQNELQQAYDAGAQQFRVEQAQAQGQLFNTHPEVYKLVKDLRQQIDSLSMNISHIAEEKEVKAIILGNLGVYLRRTFEWWDKNDYREWLKTADPEAVKVAEKAKQYFGNRLALQKAESIRNAAAVSGVSMPFDQALQQARQQIPEDEIIKELETWVHELGNRAPDARAGFLTKEIFLEKQNIPPELLEFLGVYEDNIFNAIRTLSSLSEHHLNYKFLESVKDQLQDIQNQLNAGVTDPKDLQVLITDDKNTARKKGLRPFVPDVQNRLIASDAYGPLAGFYGPDLIVSAVHEMKPVDLSSLSRWGQKAVGYSMAAKTVYSFRTHVRNFLGNQMFLLYSGQAGLVDPRNWGDFRESWMLTMAQNARSAGDRRKFLEELAEIGVTQDNVELNLINDLADAATLGPQAFARVMTPTIEGFAKKGVRKIKALGKLAGDYYAAEDDFWKILVYMNETRRHAIALGLTNPGDPNSLTDAQADRILTLFPPKTPSVKQIKDKKERAVAAFKRGMAYKSRAVTPHYTATFDFIRQAKRHGVTTFVAPFVSFQAEVVRLTGANWALVKQEAAIPEFRKIAAQRAGGALTAMVFGATILKGAAAGAAFLWKALTGGGDDDELEDITYADTMFNDQLEADMRRFLPSYYKWNDIAVIGRTKTGDYKWLDISWMNPFSVLKNPLNALVKNDDDRGILAAAQDALLTFVDPYTSPQIWLSALFEKTVSDEREAALQEFDRAPLVTGAQGVLEIALKLGVPQTFIDLKKIWDSVGKDIERGREVSTTAEVGSFLLGTKVNSLDPARQLERITLPSRREQLTLMGDTFNRQFRRESEITADAMREAYLEAQEGRRRVLEATRRDVLAVGRLMGDGRQAIQILTDSRLGNTEEASVLMGVYRKWTPSDTTIERAAAAQRVVGDTRMQDYLKYREEVQEFSPLEEPLR